MIIGGLGSAVVQLYSDTYVYHLPHAVAFCVRGSKNSPATARARLNSPERKIGLLV